VPAELRTVFLDAGGVLVNPNWERVSAVLARHGVVVPVAVLAGAEARAKHDVDRAGHGRDTARGRHLFELVVQYAGVPPSPAVEAALAELREYQARDNLWEAVPGDAPAALAALRARGLRLVVVSNANGTLRALLDRLGLLARVDLVVDSHEEGVEKPDPEIFRRALARSDSRPETTVHVGDLYHVDVLGARAAGLEPVLLDAGGLYPEADCFRVASLAALADAVEGGALGGTPR
jgi:putative hydrolase of the HAD superfamily